MRVVVVQNDRFDTPGILMEILSSRGFDVSLVHAYAGEEVPTALDGIDGVILLGGGMNVSDEPAYPYLRAEMRLARLALDARIPLMGICLGGQLLAAELGADVKDNVAEEIGWHDLTLETSAGSDALFGDLASPLTVFQWHSQTFDIPSGAVKLASSRLCGNQAFRYGTVAYGVQFHLEADEPTLNGWVREYGDSLIEAGVDGAQLLSDAKSRLPVMQSAARGFFGRWCDLIG